jgi:hypothetical protein
MVISCLNNKTLSIMVFYNLILEDYTNIHGDVIVVSEPRKYCECGVHQQIKYFMEETIGIPWDGELTTLHEYVLEMGIEKDYIGVSGGIIIIIKPLVDIKMYNRIVKFISFLYNEDFCKITIEKCQ